MLQPLAIAVIGGILISMVLSLIITPAIQYYLTRDKEAAVTDTRYAGRGAVKLDGCGETCCGSETYY